MRVWVVTEPRAYMQLVQAKSCTAPSTEVTAKNASARPSSIPAPCHRLWSREIAISDASAQLSQPRSRESYMWEATSRGDSTGCHISSFLLPTLVYS